MSAVPNPVADVLAMLVADKNVSPDIRRVLRPPVTVVDRPEKDPVVRFLAHYTGYPNGVHGLGSTGTAAEEDLAEMDAECSAERLDRAEHGESNWWETP